MIATDTTTDWLERLQLPDRGLAWLAEEMLRHAADGATIEWNEIDRTKMGVVRALFVRLIAIGHRETGLDLNFYGDRFQLERMTDDGPVTLDVDVRNTLKDWSLRVARAPSPLANGTSHR